MKCDMDCEHCTRPRDKCKGGTYHTAYTDRELQPTRVVGRKSDGIKKAYNYGRKKSKGFV